MTRPTERPTRPREDLDPSLVEELVEALRPFAEAYDGIVTRGSPGRKKWNEEMPGHWPIELTITMEDGRRARTALARAEGRGK